MSRKIERSELVFRRADVLLIAAIELAALCAGAWLLFRRPGNTVTVTVDGKPVASYPLSEEREVRLEGFGGGENLLVIRDGTACIAEADCKDRLCARHAPVSRVGDVIVCLPHRLTVTVEGAGDPPDATVT